MLDKLLELLIDYSKKGEYVDKKFADEVAKMFIELYGIKMPFNGFEFIKENHDLSFIGSYRRNEKKIYLYIPPLCDYLKVQEKKYKHLLDDNLNKMLYFNSLICELILHELEHYRQHSFFWYLNIMGKIDLNKLNIGDEFEKYRSLEIVFFDLYNGGSHFDPQLASKPHDEVQNIVYSRNDVWKELYSDLYKIDPIERLAEIRSQLVMFLSLGHAVKDYPAINAIQSLKYHKRLISGYDVSLYPTIKYFDSISKRTGLDYSVLEKYKCYDKDEDKMLEITSDNFSQDTRLQLGLAISKEEYESLSNDVEKAKIAIKKGDISL